MHDFLKLFLWQAERGSRPTRRYPRDDPRRDVGVGVVECGLYTGSFASRHRMAQHPATRGAVLYRAYRARRAVRRRIRCERILSPDSRNIKQGQRTESESQRCRASWRKECICRHDVFPSPNTSSHRSSAASRSPTATTDHGKYLQSFHDGQLFIYYISVVHKKFHGFPRHFNGLNLVIGETVVLGH